jgi:DNA-directed RNA polymerase specialized sigma24 family protein
MEERDVIAEISQINEEISAVRERAAQATAALRARRAEVVRQARAQGWSLGELADKLGVSRVRVQQFEAGDGD